MSYLSKPRLLLSLLIAVACVVVSGQAFAQTISLTESGITRTNSFRTSTQEPTWISKEDCNQQRCVHLPVVVQRLRER